MGLGLIEGFSFIKGLVAWLKGNELSKLDFKAYLFIMVLKLFKVKKSSLFIIKVIDLRNLGFN